jgi:hypothetical protein
MVEGEVPHVEPGVDEELPTRPVDAVRVGEPSVCRLGDAEIPADVDLIPLDGEQAVRLAPTDRPDDLVDVRRPAAAVERVALQDDPLVDDPLGDVVRPRAGRIVDPPRINGGVGRDRTEERHREPRGEVADGSGQPDLEPVAAQRPDARDRLRPPTGNGIHACDLAHVEDRRRPHPRVGGAVEGVDEAPRRHLSARVEAEGSPKVESVRPLVLRDGERPHHLRDHPRARGAGLVRMVEELRAGRVQQRPRVRVVGERRVDEVDVHVPAHPERATLPGVRDGCGGTREAGSDE